MAGLCTEGTVLVWAPRPSRVDPCHLAVRAHLVPLALAASSGASPPRNVTAMISDIGGSLHAAVHEVQTATISCLRGPRPRSRAAAAPLPLANPRRTAACAAHAVSPK